MGGGSFGKVLILSFRDDEEYIINRILSCMNGETEILHQGDVQNGQLHFEGLYIDEQKRIVVRENTAFVGTEYWQSVQQRADI